MAESCATCFFYRPYTSSRPQFNGVGACRAMAPQRVNDVSQSPWALVQPDEWCGDGANATTGVGYSDRTGSAVIDGAVISDSR